MLRRVRSFVRREGRITPAQENALANFWPKYGIDFSLELKDKKLFARAAPLVIDIGFGNGESTVAIALAHPEWNIIGIDVYQPGVGNLLRQLAENNIYNVRVFCCDAVEVLQNIIASNSVHRVQIFFADPWPKKRHHKRRLIQSEFVKVIVDRLQQGGELVLATDWQNYAEHMVEVLNAEPLLQNTTTETFSARDDLRPLTKFEKRGQRAGHDVWDLRFVKK
jgi:tRNA (guanine-N7-)-methyltransferase